MAGTFLCIGLSFVVVAVIILSTIGYHKIYVETVWATEIEEDLPEEETEYTMDLKEYTAKRIGTNLAVTKLKQNIKPLLQPKWFFYTQATTASPDGSDIPPWRI